MAMKIESLEVLEKADVPPGQARAIVRAIEIETALATHALATKDDLATFALTTKNDFATLTLATKNDFASFTLTTKNEFATFTLATSDDFAALRQEFTASIAATSAQVSQVRGEMHALASSGTRQMYFAVLGQMAVLLGLAYFFATHLR